MKPSDDKIDCSHFVLRLYFSSTAVLKELSTG
jgi:hypothetical protein